MWAWITDHSNTSSEALEPQIRWIFSIRKRGDKLRFSHRQIMALPKEFRRKSHFGFDLLDDMPETDRYLQNEKSFCSSEGDLVLFDANGIHRGGIVKTERRVALSLLLA